MPLNCTLKTGKVVTVICILPQFFLKVKKNAPKEIRVVGTKAGYRSVRGSTIHESPNQERPQCPTRKFADEHAVHQQTLECQAAATGNRPLPH